MHIYIHIFSVNKSGLLNYTDVLDVFDSLKVYQIYTFKHTCTKDDHFWSLVTSHSIKHFYNATKRESKFFFSFLLQCQKKKKRYP
jgi:hypothetical protein